MLFSSRKEENYMEMHVDDRWLPTCTLDRKRKIRREYRYICKKSQKSKKKRPKFIVSLRYIHLPFNLDDKKFIRTLKCSKVTVLRSLNATIKTKQ